jgi:hypothetical protein
VVGAESRDFESPDETRTPDRTKVDVVRIGTATVGRFAFEPGWRWSECVKPVAGTDSCQARHIGVVHAATSTAFGSSCPTSRASAVRTGAGR